MRSARVLLPMTLLIGVLALGMLLGPVLVERITYAAEVAKQRASRVGIDVTPDFQGAYCRAWNPTNIHFALDLRVSREYIY